MSQLAVVRVGKNQPKGSVVAVAAWGSIRAGGGCITLPGDANAVQALTSFESILTCRWLIRTCEILLGYVEFNENVALLVVGNREHIKGYMPDATRIFRGEPFTGKLVANVFSPKLDQLDLMDQAAIQSWVEASPEVVFRRYRQAVGLMTLAGLM